MRARLGAGGDWVDATATPLGRGLGHTGCSEAMGRPPSVGRGAELTVLVPVASTTTTAGRHGSVVTSLKKSSSKTRIGSAYTGNLLAEPDRAQRSLSGVVGPPRSRSRAAPCRSPLTLELSFLGCAHERVPCGGSLRAHR